MSDLTPKQVLYEVVNGRKRLTVENYNAILAYIESLEAPKPPTDEAVQAEEDRAYIITHGETFPQGAVYKDAPTITDDAVRESLYWAQESAKCRQCADYGYLIAPGAMLDVPENHVPCPTCNGKRDEYAHSQVATLTAALADRERLREERETYRRAWNRSDEQLRNPAYVRVPMAVLEEEASRTDPDEDFDRRWIWGVCPEEAERTYGTTQKEA